MNMGRRRKNKSKNIPDGWMDFDPIKDVINDINVVPFKVPLPMEKFEDDFMKEKRWTPADVMNKVPDIGLVIDLTYKSPCYYEPLEFLENGVDYIKMGCSGHVIPPEEIFVKFCDTVDTFRQEKPHLILGVHCKHGVNRTGYMICRYMVERCHYTANEAFEIFASARGYEIERETYKDEIRKSSVSA